MTRWRFKGAAAHATKIRAASKVEGCYFAGAAAGAGEGEAAGAALPAVAAAGAGVAAAACGWALGLIQQA